MGGIVGWNLDGGILKDNTSAANVTGRGDYVGGFAGRNSGLLQLKAADAASDSKTVQSSQGQGIGGIVGINEASGTIRVIGTADANGELVVIGKGVTVTGREMQAASPELTWEPWATAAVRLSPAAPNWYVPPRAWQAAWWEPPAAI